MRILFFARRSGAQWGAPENNFGQRFSCVCARCLWVLSLFTRRNFGRMESVPPVPLKLKNRCSSEWVALAEQRLPQRRGAWADRAEFATAAMQPALLFEPGNRAPFRFHGGSSGIHDPNSFLPSRFALRNSGLHSDGKPAWIALES